MYIKEQTVGTGVSSVTVTDAFSSSFDNYLIKISGGVGSTASNIQFRLGASTTGYYNSGIVVSYSVFSSTAAGDTNAAQFTRAGTGNINGLQMNFNVDNPFLTQPTTLSNTSYSPHNTASAAGFFNGFHNVSASYTAFTLIPTVGTLTGGTIRVYGYRQA